MILQDIYNQLAYGELRELVLGGATADAPSDGIKPADFPRLLPHIQMGLTSLHTKCALKEGSVTFSLALPRAMYLLRVGNDVPADWADDLLMIERVYGRYEGLQYEIPLDDLNDLWSIRKPSASTLLIPTDTAYAPWLLETTELVVKYRANHPAIDIAAANAAPGATEIELPTTHLEALCLFIASRVHNPIGMTPGAMHEGNNYAMKYEMAVQKLNDLGMEQRGGDTNYRLVQNNWP
jgi:hypothetical protein